MNVEAEIVSYLGSKGFDASCDVPAQRPAGEFVTVERTSGGSTGTRFLDAPSVAVRSYASTRLGAAQLAYRVDSAMLSMADAVADVCSVERNSIYNYPGESGPRYQAVYDLVTHC